MAQFATSLVDSTTNAVDISISCSDGVFSQIIKKSPSPYQIVLLMYFQHWGMGML